MKIGRINIMVEIDETPCIVVLNKFDNSKKNLLLKMITSLTEEEQLKVVKLNDTFKFTELTKDDMYQNSNGA